MLACLNQHRVAMVEQSKDVLGLRIAMTSIPEHPWLVQAA